MYIVLNFNNYSSLNSNNFFDGKVVNNKDYAFYLATEYLQSCNSLAIKIPNDYYDALSWFKEHNIPNAFVDE